ncbi:hypothetical protein HK096_000751, partial [Nowakowskiella sp. JEL0078]
MQTDSEDFDTRTYEFHPSQVLVSYEPLNSVDLIVISLVFAFSQDPSHCYLQTITAMQEYRRFSFE